MLWLWSISISVLNWSHALHFPTKSLHIFPPPNHLLISGSLEADCYTWGGGGAAAWLCDTWQELQLWSVFCKESLAAENAAVAFTAQSLQSIPPWILPQSGGVGGGGKKETSPCTVSFLTHSITSLFISFFNELTLTSADSVSGIWASSSLSPQWPPPKWQTRV